ncbi:MAG TPA: tripartite tricarboxylate transporter substrate binding protein [Burkholderiales bacterium]|nr:tripartite tricarboxylate transporter substrate binding protein [Burkholderiales bacterium]
MTQFRAFVSALLALAASGASAQGWPSRPVHVVVPYPAGGPNDIIVRMVGKRLGETLGEPIVVENRPGAGGNIGTDSVAKSAPDGYTLVSVGPGALIINPLLGKVPYDTMRDFAPVTIMAVAPNALVAHPSFPAKSVKDLVALAKQKPGAINYASGGTGSTPHLAAALFAVMAGVQLTHVPYKGTGPATADLVGGQVQIAFLGIPTVLPHIRSGKLRALAVTGARRSPELPDVPTVAEAGVPGYELSPWYGLLAPAGTPSAVVARLAAEATKIVREPAMREQLVAQGAEPAGGTPEEFARTLRSDAALWKKVVKDAGIRAD